MIYRIGTRGSKLALAQAELVRRELAAHFPAHDFELVVIRTTGDRMKETALREIGTKGIFTKEIEECLLDGTIDMAVHSMKDMPTELPEGLMLAKPLMREDARDVLILREAASLDELPEGAVIGTGSLRRQYQLLRLRPDLKMADIRGNIETRIRKMEEQKMDGIVLAAAGLLRLGMSDRITQYLSFDEMLPAPAQGVLAVELASERKDIAAMLQNLEDKKVSLAAEAERHFLALMGGGCHQPVGAVAEIVDGRIWLRVMDGDESSQKLRFAEVTGLEPVTAAEEAACKIHALKSK